MKRKWTKEKVLEMLKPAGIEELGLIYRNNKGLYGAARRFFGNWESALDGAGISESRRPSLKWSREKLTDEIRRIYKEEGGDIRSSKYPVSKLYNAANRIFGGWNRMFEELGIKRENESRWNRSEIVRFLKILHKGGEKLNSGYVQKIYHGLYSAGCREFGSWRNVVTAVGIDYDSVKRKTNA